jgi:hypothetical protein
VKARSYEISLSGMTRKGKPTHVRIFIPMFVQW